MFRSNVRADYRLLLIFVNNLVFIHFWEPTSIVQFHIQ